ncbi:MAG TPA: tetratricopeptide repeat protein [Candidatus Angelobacter sp.]|jgi:superkiller protein 3|nr:tetratricopeptide repeat protein [Candidatus Angelobacter sp.]
MTVIFLALLLFAQATPSKVDTHAAIERFKQEIASTPNDPTPYVGLGQAYLQASKYAEAIPALTHALELKPDLPGVHRMLGYALLAQGYAAEAVPHFDLVQDHAALGIAQIEMNHFSEAVTNLQTALLEKPNDPDLIYYLGRASQMLANECKERLLTQFPESGRAHQLKAENYSTFHEISKAEGEFRAALAARPDLPGVHLELGELYAQSSRFSEAEQEFRKERQDRPGSAEAAYRLGQILLQEGKAQEAVHELKESNDLMPNMPETLQSLGKAALLSEDKALAEKSWIQLLSIEKEGRLATQAHFDLATLYRSEGKRQEAETHMQLFQKARRATQ